MNRRKQKQLKAVWITAGLGIGVATACILALKYLSVISTMVFGGVSPDLTYTWLFIISPFIILLIVGTAITIFGKDKPNDPLGIRDENG